MLSTNTNLCNPHSHPVRWVNYCFDFAEGETEAQSGKAACPRSHSWQGSAESVLCCHYGQAIP